MKTKNCHSRESGNLVQRAWNQIPAFAGMTLLLLLAACIDVEDFGDSWGKAVPDPCISNIAKDFYDDAEKPVNLNDTVRVMKVGSHLFMMLKEKKDDAGGSIFQFRIDNGTYIPMSPNEDKREQFAKDYPNSDIVVNSETATINKLDAKSLKLLEEIAGKPDYWKDGAKKPYNPNGNKACKL